MSTELSLSLSQDRPGELSKVVEAIARGGVNLEGIAEQDGIVHLLVAEAAPARAALEGAGLRVGLEREQLVAEVEDRPGALAEVTAKLAAAGINLHHVYVATGMRIVLGVEDLAAARQALGMAEPAPNPTQSLPARQPTQTLPSRQK